MDEVMIVCKTSSSSFDLVIIEELKDVESIVRSPQPLHDHDSHKRESKMC
jgi:hypothetical protein